MIFHTCRMNRHTRVLARSVVLSAMVIASLFLYTLPASAAGAVHCVALTGETTSAPCVNPTAYTTIQAAVKAAGDGDEIRIAHGTYISTDQYVVSVVNKSLILRGGYASSNWQSPTPPGTTIIDGQTERGGVLVFGNSTVTLERMTITHGHNGTGGGIEANLMGVLTLNDLVISKNAAGGSGGGLFVVGGSLVMNRTQVLDNTAGEDGGGFYGLRLNATESSINGNTAARNAGGIDVLYASIENSQIVSNTAVSGVGGGMHFNPSQIGGTLAMTRTRVLDNHAGGRGGALFLGSMSKTDLSWSLLANNQASDGDSLVVAPNSLAPLNMSLTNVTVASASLSPHAAIQLSSGPMSLNLTNTVVTSHTIGIERVSSASLSGDYNAFFNNGTNQVVAGSSTALPFTHLITTDPQFNAAGVGDFHLRDTSPLRDAGDPSLSYVNQQDLDGVQIPVGPSADIGAYEYISRSYRTYLPLIIR